LWLRTDGYAPWGRTICLHPFDRSFYRRDRAIPALGLTNSSAARRWVGRAPRDLARHILRFLDEAGPRTFIFAITMGNHGPWLRKGAETECYLEGLAQSDAMLRILIGGLEERCSDAVLSFYGDHLRSLPRDFAALGFDDWRSDYAVWSRAASRAGKTSPRTSWVT
jgi:phosphoglycerol transferase MdoB-like AlkP superfamily enzyme